MLDADVAARVKKHLGRHVEWLEEGIRAAQTASDTMSEEDLEALLAAQAKRNAELTHLWREQAGLLREWRVARNAGQEDRTEVRRMADHAQQLTEELRALQENLITALSLRLLNRQDAIHSLRRGRDLLGKYRPGGEDTSGFLDKRA